MRSNILKRFLSKAIRVVCTLILHSEAIFILILFIQIQLQSILYRLNFEI